MIAVWAIAFVTGSQQLLAADDTEVLLLNELKKRDAVIASLLKRVEELERRVQDTVVWVGQDPGGPVMMRQIDQLQSQLEILTDKPAEPEGPQVAGGSDEKKPRGPGAVEVDEFAAERALERTLTNQGALLLPKGVYEIEPFFSYARREPENLIGVVSEDLPVALATGTQTRKRNEFSFGLRGRVGLPYESQLEVSVPYRVVNQETVSAQFSGTSSQSDTGQSIGDI
ncbi:MAG: hypothetical protein WBP89_14770, partial [Sedimenticolaceae bacterium]